MDQWCQIWVTMEWKTFAYFDSNWLISTSSGTNVPWLALCWRRSNITYYVRRQHGVILCIKDAIHLYSCTWITKNLKGLMFPPLWNVQVSALVVKVSVMNTIMRQVVGLFPYKRRLMLTFGRSYKLDLANDFLSLWPWRAKKHSPLACPLIFEQSSRSSPSTSSTFIIKSFILLSYRTLYVWHDSYTSVIHFSSQKKLLCELVVHRVDCRKYYYSAAAATATRLLNYHCDSWVIPVHTLIK